MSRSQLTEHDRYRIGQAREALAVETDMADDRAMARRIGHLEAVLQQLVEMVDEAVEGARLAPQRSSGQASLGELPVFGPTLVNRDDDTDAHVIVQVALVLSREHLRTALAIGYAEMNDGRELAELTVKEIREEVEGHLGACAVIEIDRETRSVSARLSRPDRAQLLADLDAALDRAYPGVDE